jgi:hypothetical protein
MSDEPHPLEGWPQAPEPGKLLYVAESLAPELRTKLELDGWKVIDTRLMPNDSDGARADAWKAYMEGVRNGSIRPDKTRLKHVELEGRALGLLGAKGAPKEKPKEQIGKNEIDVLMNM